MLVSRDTLTALDRGALRAIEDEEGKEWHAHKPCATKEHRPQLRVLTLPAIGGVEEPNGCIDANAESPTPRRVGDKAVCDGKVRKRALLACRSDDLEGDVSS
jgi:hypothetical protein